MSSCSWGREQLKLEVFLDREQMLRLLVPAGVSWICRPERVVYIEIAKHDQSITRVHGVQCLGQCRKRVRGRLTVGRLVAYVENMNVFVGFRASCLQDDDVFGGIGDTPGGWVDSGTDIEAYPSLGIVEVHQGEVFLQGMIGGGGESVPPRLLDGLSAHHN